MLSPIGEPLATLPPSVPAFLIGTEAKRSHISGGFGIVLDQCRIGVAERSAGADPDVSAVLADLVEPVDLADIDDVAEVAQLLGDPKADVGAAREDGRLGQLGAELGELGQGTGCVEGRTISLE